MATVFKLIKIADYPFQALKSAPKIFERETRAAMWKAVFTLQRAVKDKTPVGAGPVHLQDSILADVQGKPVNLRGIVSTSILHGEIVELGTKPHMPPYYPIFYWVTRKLGIVISGGRSMVKHGIVIRGYYSFQDELASEKTFRQLVESVRSVLRQNYNLNDTCFKCDPPQNPVNEAREMAKTYLIHYAEIHLDVYEYVAY